MSRGVSGRSREVFSAVLLLAASRLSSLSAPRSLKYPAPSRIPDPGVHCTLALSSPQVGTGQFETPLRHLETPLRHL